MVEVCTDIMFIRMILEFLEFGIEIERPVKIQCDNGGAIFMGNNAKKSVRTTHINVRYHFIREYVVDGMVEIVFVPLEENDSDIFTKNVSKETYQRLSEKSMMDIESI